MEFPILIFVGFIFGIMGFVFLIITTILKKHYNGLYANCTKSTTGIFDRLTERLGTHDIDDTRSYYPIYKYVVNGQQYYCKGHKGTYYQKDINKENTIIYYNPNNPRESYTDKKTIDIITKVFRILGIIFFIIGITLIALKIAIFK